MLEGFSGGLIIALIDFLMVFVVLGGLAGGILGFQKCLRILEQRTSNTKDTVNNAMQAVATPVSSQTSITNAHIAAVAAAIHEFISMPADSYRIVGIRPVNTVNTWKIAGRLELMGMDLENTERF